MAFTTNESRCLVQRLDESQGRLGKLTHDEDSPSNPAEKAKSLVPKSTDDSACDAKFTQLMDLMSDGILVCDSRGQLIDANPAACNLLGFARETAHTLNLADLLHAHDCRSNGSTVRDLLVDRKERGEWVLRHQTGFELFVEVTASQLIDGSFICIIHDNTKGCVAETALRDSQQRIALAIEATEIGIWEWNVHTGFVTWDATMFQIYGIPQTADRRVTYETWARAVHPDDKDQQELLLRKHASESAINRRAFRIRRPDGEMRYIEAVETIRRNWDGETEWVVGTNLDVTERKRTENALRAREAQLRQFYESKLIGVFYWNMAGQVIDANDKFLEMIGYERADLDAGRIDWQKMTPEEYKPLDEISVAELQSVGVNAAPFEKCYVRKDGSLLPVLVAGAMLDEPRFNGVAFILDISQRKKSEQLSRLLLHEVNHRAKNLLAVVQGMALQTSRDADQTAFVDLFLSRLASLSACHDLVVQSDWQGVAVRDLVATQLAIFGERIGVRIFGNGPDLQLKPEAAQAISLALHELETNAVKYGALSTVTGRVNIRWDVIVDGETPHFRMSWEEVDGPPVGHTDGHVGFGRKILINMVQYTLDAAVSLTYPNTGCRWSFTAPLERVCAKGGQRAKYRDNVSAASLFATPEP